MIFIWGTKVRTAEVGHVAELCGRCRAITAHRFSEIRHVSHVYYIPFGRGKVVAYSAACAACGASREVAANRYAQVSKREAKLADLVRHTNPGVEAELEELKAFDERKRRGQLSPQERIAAMQEALAGPASRAQARVASVHFDARSGLLALAMVAFPCVLIAASSDQSPGLKHVLLNTALASGALGLGLLLHSLATDVSRFIRRRLGEPLRSALASFQPSPEELAELVRSMKASGWALGKKISAEWLTQQLYSHDSTRG